MALWQNEVNHINGHMIGKKNKGDESMKNKVYPADVSTQSFGKLQVNVTSSITSRPIEDATIAISLTGNPSNVVEIIKTDTVGQTIEVELPAPKLEYSLEPSAEQPYSEYTIMIKAPEYESMTVKGVQVLPYITAIQNSALLPERNLGKKEECYVIGPNTLFGQYPPKIAESEIKEIGEKGSLLPENPIIPEFIIVHDGPPTDLGAQNYYVKYRDYIKNVASSEVYATWPEATIQANVLAILSFTLNRIYTDWYKNKGYSFNITSSTAFDHKFIPERNIFEPISRVVDTIFTNYLSFPDVKQPILAQYCDGKRISCPNWMTQWGAKSLGDQGNSAIEILKHFYGETMYISTANEVSGVPYSWPGAALIMGTVGDKVKKVQEQLNGIAKAYPLLPTVEVDGAYGEATAEAVKLFQKIFKLPQTEAVDYATWYKISEIYVAISRLAELK